MESHCTKPGESANPRPPRAPRRAHARLWSAFFPFALLALGLSGCTIIYPPSSGEGCTSLEEMCPNLECEAGFLIDDEGCALCECADSTPEPQPEPQPEPPGCSSDGDCQADEYCVFDGGNGGEPGPRDAGPGPTEPSPEDAGPGPTEPAEDGGPAPEPPTDAGAAPPCDPAIYEGCVDSDLDSDEDRLCEPNADGTCGGSGEDRPIGDPPTGELGRCLPIACPAIGIACPSGQRPEYDYSTNPCGDARCVPVEPEPSSCEDDSDCPGSQYCEILDECASACAPGETACPDVCVVIGRCVEPPSPTGCSYDDECGTGFICEIIEQCGCSSDGAPEDDAAPPPPDGDNEARPAPPCYDDCVAYGQCVWNPENVTCYGDGECGEGQRCDYLESCLPPPDCPNCLIACLGVCVEEEPEPTPCMGDSDCSGDEVCDQENYCEAHPGCDGFGCLPVCAGRCVPPEPAPSDRCLEQADCAEGYRCANEVDFCYCPDPDGCDVCYWQCVLDDGV